MGEYELAIDSFNQIIEHIPDETFSLNKIGSCYLYLEKYDLALSYFNKVLEIDSEDSDALLNMGLYYNDLEMYDDALIYLDKCIEIQPNDGAALLQMANIYKNKQDYHNALRYVNQALGQNPNDLMLQLTKNLLLSNIGEFEESINGFKSISLEGIDNYGLISMYYIYYGQALQTMGKNDDALGLYDEYLIKYDGFPKDEIQDEKDRLLILIK
ncbi:TPR repeat-containing protein YrrB [Methanobrevibacter thaueri]|uniref:TPR repeat-containing protein YrrB n=2 Tax=Methanobrevibacter thaueri TaxID=190975 RepID=A0A315XNN6_9EURY|nr:TPR repeat-containing protein YrrB [Methanobrevibacter thaueri]